MSRSTLLVIAWIMFGLAVRWTFSPATVPSMTSVDDEAIRTVLSNFSRAHAKSWEATDSPDGPDDPGDSGDSVVEDARPSAPHPSITEATAQLKQLGIRELWWQSYDVRARVVVGVGPDGQPGAAGVDDGFNGKVDDRDELGATGTDDTFSVIPGDDWDPNQRPDAELWLATGGWVTHDHPQNAPISAALRDHLVWANRTCPPSNRVPAIGNQSPTGTPRPPTRGRWIAVGDGFERMIDADQ